MRNWTKTLSAASYRGVPFYVDYEGMTGGKRLALHEFAGGRTTLIEEMGLKTSGFDVTAYVIGDLSDVSARALVAAMQAPGPGFVTLPIDGGLMACVDDWHRSREKDRMGHIAFDIHFVPLSNEAGFSLSTGDVISTVAANIVSAAAGFARLF